MMQVVWIALNKIVLTNARIPWRLSVQAVLTAAVWRDVPVVTVLANAGPIVRRDPPPTAQVCVCKHL
jgi:hypothetical protein